MYVPVAVSTIHRIFVKQVGRMQ